MDTPVPLTLLCVSACLCVWQFCCISVLLWVSVCVSVAFLCKCVSGTDWQTKGQDDWWLPPFSWAGEAASTDNEAKEEELPLIWLYPHTATQTWLLFRPEKVGRIYSIELIAINWFPKMWSSHLLSLNHRKTQSNESRCTYCLYPAHNE